MWFSSYFYIKYLGPGSGYDKMYEIQFFLETNRGLSY